MRFYGHIGCVMIGMFLLHLTATPLYAQELAYTGSLYFATGNYIFTDRTSSISLSNGLTLSTNTLNVSASLPIINQNTPWISSTGAGSMPSGGTQRGQVNGQGRRGRQVTLVDTTQYNQMGIGDLLVHADMEIFKESRITPSFSLSGDVKFPIADVDRGFGTGKWDYGGGAILAKMAGTNMLFVDVTYWVLGDFADLELRNTLVYSASWGRTFSAGQYGLLISFLGSTTTLSGTDPPIQAGLALNYQLQSGRSLNGGINIGLTESVPDVSLSFGWRLGL